MIYTFGTWAVSEGHADDFEHAWQQSVGQLAPDLPDVVFRLLRDVEDPGRYVSMGGPWRSQEQVDGALGKQAYQDSMAATRGLVESGELRPYELVLEVS